MTLYNCLKHIDKSLTAEVEEDQSLQRGTDYCNVSLILTSEKWTVIV